MNFIWWWRWMVEIYRDVFIHPNPWLVIQQVMVKWVYEFCRQFFHIFWDFLMFVCFVCFFLSWEWSICWLRSSRRVLITCGVEPMQNRDAKGPISERASLGCRLHNREERCGRVRCSSLTWPPLGHLSNTDIGYWCTIETDDILQNHGTTKHAAIRHFQQLSLQAVNASRGIGCWLLREWESQSYFFSSSTFSWCNRKELAFFLDYTGPSWGLPFRRRVHYAIRLHHLT